jgi:hypothetical protein
MRQAAVLKREIEAKLQTRIPGALSPRMEPAARLLPTGIAALDRSLGGGLPQGQVVEVVGPRTSGRTALAFSLLRQGTREGVCALVDLHGAFDLQSAAAAGVELQRLLWVRLSAKVPKAQRSLFETGPGEARAIPEKPWARLDRALRATDLILQAGGFCVVVLDMGDLAPEQATRIPLATWYRFRRAAEAADTLLLLLTREPCSQASAARLLRCSPDPDGSVVLGGQVLAGLGQKVEVVRERHTGGRKGPGRAMPDAIAWTSGSPWARGVV